MSSLGGAVWLGLVVVGLIGFGLADCVADFLAGMLASQLALATRWRWECAYHSQLAYLQVTNGLGQRCGSIRRLRVESAGSSLGLILHGWNKCLGWAEQGRLQQRSGGSEKPMWRGRQGTSCCCAGARRGHAGIPGVLENDDIAARAVLI